MLKRLAPSFSMVDYCQMRFMEYLDKTIIAEKGQIHRAESDESDHQEKIAKSIE